MNGVSLGRKKPEALTAVFELSYEPGELKVVADSGGKHSLRTAGPVSTLRVQCDRETLFADGQSLAYLTVDLVDKDGLWNSCPRRHRSKCPPGRGPRPGWSQCRMPGRSQWCRRTW